jgi:hypothetical protein
MILQDKTPARDAMTTRIELRFKQSNIDNTIAYVLSKPDHTLSKRFPTAKALEDHLYGVLFENFPSNPELQMQLPAIEADICSLVVKLYKGLYATVMIYSKPTIAGDSMALQPGLVDLNAGTRVAEGHDRLLEVERNIPGHRIWTAECLVLTQL